MRIGLDIMGSDHGPDVPIRGAVLAARELPSDTRLVLIGDAATIEKGLQAEGADASAFDIVPSTDDITMHDNPTKALQPLKAAGSRGRSSSRAGPNRASRVSSSRASVPNSHGSSGSSTAAGPRD